MRQYKILHLNHVAYIGGAEVALLNLLSKVNRKNYDHAALLPNGELAAKLLPLKISRIPIPVLPGVNRYTFPRYLASLPLLYAKILRHKPDMLSANTSIASLYTGILAKLFHIPSMAHIRDIEPLGRIGQRLLRQNTRIIADSQAVQRHLAAQQIPESQLLCIYEGVDITQYQPLKTPRGQEKDSSVTLGIVGQIGERKGHLYALKALRSLLPLYPELKLWILGKEPEQSREGYTRKLQQYVQEHQLREHVLFWGFRSDIPELLEQLDILLLPSLQEPFGKIVIEAMAMEKPVIASNVGGVPEIIDDGITGLLVPPRDDEAIRRALEQLLHQRDRWKQMGRAGRKRVEQYFSLERNVKSTEQVYQQLLELPRNKHPHQSS